MPLDVTKGSITLDYAEKVAATLAEDIVGSAGNTRTSSSTGTSYQQDNIVAGAENPCGAKTQIYDANSMAVATGFISARAATADTLKFRLYMDGVLTAESAYVPTSGTNVILVGTRALSGSKACEVKLRNCDTVGRYSYIPSAEYSTGGLLASGIGIGSIKLV